MKPYYEHGGITIYHGDCLDVLPTLEDKTFDLCLTDPPYNFGFDYGTHDDSQDPAVYAEWCHRWFVEVRRTAQNVAIFPGHGNLPVWWDVTKPSAIGCWHKPGNPASSHIGWAEWEPWLYWGKRVGGSSVVRAPVNKQRDTGDHPCPKPLQLMRAMLGKFKPASVIDPFSGSGSTLRAAKDLGMRAVGIEIEERFCELTVRRLGQEVLAI